MDLSEADQQKIADWIKQKCGQMRCTCCGESGWRLAQMATLPIGVNLHSTRFFYSAGIPHIEVCCTNCGHTLFFNPGIMGFKPDEPKPEKIPPGDVSKSVARDSA